MLTGSVFLGDRPFRIGVPCLSAISGYLALRRALPARLLEDAEDQARTFSCVPIWTAFLLVGLRIQPRAPVSAICPTRSMDPAQWLSMALRSRQRRSICPCILARPDALYPAVAASGIAGEPFPRVTLLALHRLCDTAAATAYFSRSHPVRLLGWNLCEPDGVNIKMLDRFAAPIAARFLATQIVIAVGSITPARISRFGSTWALRLTSIAGIIGSWAISELLVRTRFGEKIWRREWTELLDLLRPYPLLVLFWMIWNPHRAQLLPRSSISPPVHAIAILVASHNLVGRLGRICLECLPQPKQVRNEWPRSRRKARSRLFAPSKR